MTPKNLENLMIAKQSTKFLTENWEAMAEYLSAIALLRRQYYLFCVGAGFTAQEALALASAFQLPAGPAST